MHGGQKPAGGTDVGEHLDIEIAVDLETPVAVAGAGADRDALVVVAVLHVVGVHVKRLSAFDCEDDGWRPVARVVDQMQADLARSRGVIDDSHESLANRIRCRGKQRHIAGLGELRVDADAGG